MTNDLISRASLHIKLFLAALDGLGQHIHLNRKQKKPAQGKKRKRPSLTAPDRCEGRAKRRRTSPATELAPAAVDDGCLLLASINTINVDGDLPQQASLPATRGPSTINVDGDLPHQASLPATRGPSTINADGDQPQHASLTATRGPSTINADGDQPQHANLPATRGPAQERHEIASNIVGACFGPNNASLPNIIHSMSSHGPPVDQWEGGYGGERSIQDLKPFLKGVCVVRPSELKAAMIRYYQNTMLARLSDDFLLPAASPQLLVNGATTTRPKTTRNSHQRIYSNREEVERILERHSELSAALYSVEEKYIVLVKVKGQEGEGIRYLQIIQRDISAVEIDLLHLSVLSMEGEAAVAEPAAETFDTFLLFLPTSCFWHDQRHTTDPDPSWANKYIAVADDYRVMREDGTYGLKKISTHIWD
jgi:hypothetical protein